MPKASLLKPQPKNKIEKSKDVTFEFYAPQAKKVRLAGDFNGWDPSKCNLSKEMGGKWRVTLNLKPGHYQYRYQVDGNWENDQRSNVKSVPNAFGSWNCLIEVN